MISAQSQLEAAGRLPSLWFGVLGPPVIWALRFMIAYAMVPYACWGDSTLGLHLLTAAALLGTLGAGWLAWRAWHRVRDGSADATHALAARIRFMALLGLFSSGLFFLVIVAEGLAIILVDPCHTGGSPVA